MWWRLAYYAGKTPSVTYPTGWSDLLSFQSEIYHSGEYALVIICCPNENSLLVRSRKHHRLKSRICMGIIIISIASSTPFFSPNRHRLSHTHLAVHWHSTLLQLNIPLPLSLIRNTPMVHTSVHSTINLLPDPMHPHTPIHNLQQRRHRQRQRQENIQTVPTPDARGPDAHDDEVDHREQGLENRGDEEEGRFELVHGGEDDFGEGKEEAEGGEGEDYAEGCAVDRAVGRNTY
jgi:hypothetical protein